jgi:hypothetical protein
MIEETMMISELSAEHAYAVGAAVGSLLQQGMPTGRAVAATVTIGEFVRRGMAAQQAVDEILAAYAAESFRHTEEVKAALRSDSF